MPGCINCEANIVPFYGNDTHRDLGSVNDKRFPGLRFKTSDIKTPFSMVLVGSLYANHLVRL